VLLLVELVVVVDVDVVSEVVGVDVADVVGVVMAQVTNNPDRYASIIWLSVAAVSAQLVSS
jgi:hypothetical protein